MHRFFRSLESFSRCCIDWGWLSPRSVPPRLDILLFAAGVGAITHCYSGNNGRDRCAACGICLTGCSCADTQRVSVMHRSCCCFVHALVIGSGRLCEYGCHREPGMQRYIMCVCIMMSFWQSAEHAGDVVG
jgi:hypothetical protein